MPITHKIASKQNLAQYQVWVVDTDFNSRYFQLSQVPEVFTAGRNAFLINGSPELVQTTEVLVELIDANGNAVFLRPIKNYVEGLARVVSVEIYEDTPPGLATLTILGHISQDAAGNLPPDQFTTAYNVKWQRRIMISPTLGNTSPVRLDAQPEIEVSEILNPFRQGQTAVVYVSGSGGSQIEGAPYDPVIEASLVRPYHVEVSTPTFVKQMEGGLLMCTVGGVPFTSSITTVINNAMMQIDPPFTQSLNGTGSFMTSFLTTDFTMSFSGSPSYTLTQSTRSFADITLTNLTTFSGDIYRVKTYVSSIDEPGNPQLLSDTRVVAPEMMQTSSFTTGQVKLRTGYFIDNPFVQRYWLIGGFAPTSSFYNPG